MPDGQMEPCTELKCEYCGMPFSPKNRNGVKARFCKPDCSIAWHNAQRLKGAALLKEKQQPCRQGPSRQAQAISRKVFQALVPIDQRAELIRQACANLGITDPAAIEAALQRNGCPPAQRAVLSTQDSGLSTQDSGLSAQDAAPEAHA